MKTTNYIALLIFVAAFGFSAVIANFVKIEQGSLVLWNDARTAQKISALLRQDVEGGQDRNINEDSVVATLNYTTRSENLDDVNLPRDFQRAWRAHMRAWRREANFLTGTRNYSGRQALYIRQRNSYEINRTWKKVLQSAKEHGAEIPEGAL